MNSSQRMTEIKFWGCTHRGTAEGDHGVFTHSGGTVFAGQIAGDAACVGVVTLTDGRTFFVECDADGELHGRWLECDADGDTVYCRYEHGSEKEYAVLYADGTCTYDGEDCRADFAPFVALRAKVVPIKARLRTNAPTAASLYAAFISRPPPPSRSIGHCFGTRRSSRRPTPTRCALAASAISLRGPCGTATAKQMHRASNLDDAPAEGCTTHAPQPPA
jgi:hypothetical protein